MINSQLLHAAIVFGLCLALAVLAGAVLLGVLNGNKPDGNVGMSILAILALLQGYVQADKAANTLRNGSAPR